MTSLNAFIKTMTLSLLLGASNLAAAATIIAQIESFGGMPMPGGPYRWGTYVYDNGDVYSIHKYRDGNNQLRDVAVHTFNLTPKIVTKLTAAARNLKPVELERDSSRPRCEDAPITTYSVVNGEGVLVPIRDYESCVEGHRPNFELSDIAHLLEGISRLSNFGS